MDLFLIPVGSIIQQGPDRFPSTVNWESEEAVKLVRTLSLQEAQKRMKIKKPNQILVIHLKRCKYIEQLGRYKKYSGQRRVWLEWPQKLIDGKEKDLGITSFVGYHLVSNFVYLWSAIQLASNFRCLT